MRNKKENKVESIPEMEGYATEERTISIARANVWAVVLLVATGLVGTIFMFALWGSISNGEIPDFFAIILLATLVVGIAVHELIHGLTWMWVTRSGFNHLRFGLMKGAVYCHIDVPMAKRDYVIGALMPLMLMGVAPYVLAFALGSFFLIIFGIIFISSAIGDIMIVWAIRKEPPDALVFDHPTKGGCVVYHKISTTEHPD